MIDYNVYQKAIEQLVSAGHIILQVVMPDGNCLYFSVYQWQEGYFNTAQSVDFNTVEGINITDFLIKNAERYNNYTTFMASFNKVIDESSVVRCEFSKTSIWYKWSSPVKLK